MQTKETIEFQIEQLKQQFGEWAYDIPLPHNVWTKGNLKRPHTRLKRIVQIVKDFGAKPLSACRILDLGCLDGLFSIELALQGAETVGVEIREANIRKAAFCRDLLQLQNLTFVQDDVRNISPNSMGKFDAIICSGILYHLPASDVIKLTETMFAMTTKLVVIDTHVALQPVEGFRHEGAEYWGKTIREHADEATQDQKAKRLLYSWDNVTSFHFTRPSLVNLLTKTGFSSVYECFVPAHLNFGKPGIESRNRCTFAAIKSDMQPVLTSPAANGLREFWPEDTLSYGPDSDTTAAPKGGPGSIIRKVLSKVKSRLTPLRT